MKPEIKEKIKALRELLHSVPEEGLKEYKSTSAIKAAMAELGLEELDTGTQTGCAYRLRSGKPAPAICLRADIDAIESSGRMLHACGHDHHAAGLYGAAILLNELRDGLERDVVFLFQPAEEYVAGAKFIISSDFMEREGIGEIYGLHNMPNLPVGTAALAAGPLMAAKDSFEIKIKGRGGHGAMPELCADPIVASAAVITALQTVVSRNISSLDSAVVTVSSIHSGSTDNLIEDEVSLRGSVRSLQPAARETVLRRMESIVSACAAAYGCEGSFSLAGGVPAVINSESLYSAAKSAAEACFGAENVFSAKPQMISEDFSWYLASVPGFYAFVGSGVPGKENAPLHSAKFCAHDDTALYAAEFLCNIVMHKSC